jgi:hypothetical protein
MTRFEDPASQGPRRWSRSFLATAGCVYLVLAAVGIGALVEFVPGLFDPGELTLPRVLVLLVLLIFVVAPVAGVAYLILSALIEGFFMGMGWLFQSCFRALVRFFKRLVKRTED